MIKDARHYDLIVAPVITEKATMASDNNQFVFKVRREATKPQIKAAIEKLFDVKVTASIRSFARARPRRSAACADASRTSRKRSSRSPTATASTSPAAFKG